MRLKAEPYSHPRDIIAVTAQCANLRYKGAESTQQTSSDAVKWTDVIKQYESSTMALEEISIDKAAVKEFSDTIVRNFNCAFGLSD